MGKLGVSDIEKWDTAQIAAVFGISRNVADHSVSTSTHLKDLQVFETWSSYAADAARTSVGKTRKDLDRHGEIAAKVAEAARKAEEEVQQVQDALKKLKADVAAAKFVLDPDAGKIYDPDPPSMKGWTDQDKRDYRDHLERLNLELAKILTDAVTADHDLATAINNADGEKNIVVWKPSMADVVFAGSGLITSGKVDMITEIWRSSMGEHPTGIDAKIAPWLKEIESLKITRLGGAASVLTAIPSVFADRADGNSWGEAIARETAATAAGMGGAWAGAEVGAAFGTAICPGAGTVLGLVLGAAGGMTFSFLASKGVDKAID